MSAETRGHTPTYFRNARGTMVHRAGCSAQTPNTIWWNWAQGKTVEQIVADSAKNGIAHQWCKRCIPGDKCINCNGSGERARACRGECGQPGVHLHVYGCRSCDGTGVR